MILALVFVNACGDSYEAKACNKECGNAHDTCLLITLSSRTTPGGTDGLLATLYLSCQSAYYVCQDSCGGTSRF